MIESLFEPISEHEPRPENWNPKKKLRVQRLEDEVVPSMFPYMDDIGNDGRLFMHGVINQLREDCVADAESFFGNHLLPLYVLYHDGSSYYKIGKEVEPLTQAEEKSPFRSQVIKPKQEKMRYTTSETFKHNPQTIKAADVILAALTPRLGISMYDRHEVVLDRAIKLRDFDQAHITDGGRWIRFATILPGICVRNVFRESNALGDRNDVVKRFDLEIWRPDQYGYYYPKTI